MPQPKDFKTISEARAYRYGQWGGRPNGYAYDETLCAMEVQESGRGGTFHQCARKNGHGPEGLFCKQHDPATIKARDEAAAEKRREHGQALRRKWRIEELRIKIADASVAAFDQTGTFDALETLTREYRELVKGGK